MKLSLRRRAVIAVLATILMAGAVSWGRAQRYVSNDVYIGDFVSPYGTIRIFSDMNQPRTKMDDGDFTIQIGGTVPNQQFFTEFVGSKDYVGTPNSPAHHFSWSLSVKCEERRLRSWHFFWYDSHDKILAIQHFDGALIAASATASGTDTLRAVVMRKFCS